MIKTTSGASASLKGFYSRFIKKLLTCPSNNPDFTALFLILPHARAQRWDFHGMDAEITKGKRFHLRLLEA